MTAPVVIGSSQDGPTFTVNQLLKYPNMVPQIVLDMTRAQFIGDLLLRQGPTAVGGAVAWHDPMPIFALEDGEIVAEYAEIPGIEFPGYILHTRATAKTGLAVKVSQEMIDRNDTGTVMDQMRMARNTLVRQFDRQFMATVFSNAAVPTMAATTAWSLSTGTFIRKDIATAALSIQRQFYGVDSDNRFGYNPDTIVVNNDTITSWLDSDEVNKVFASSPLSSLAPRYTGALPTKFFGYDIIRSWQVPANTALICERGTMGFVSDERPMQGTPLYEDRPRETWRSDFTRITVMALDNPKSAMIITGV